jgi:hypothetical protein
MQDGLLERIRSRGYWRINFQPNSLNSEKLSLAQCRSAVEGSSVNLRGWDYPHVPQQNNDRGGVLPSGDFQEGWINWWNHIEFWRMYRSRQFLHYLALREDWFEESDWAKNLAKEILPGQRLGTGGAVNQITEIFEFLSRLGRAGLYVDGVQVSISLENTENRELWVDSSKRMPFSFPRKTGAKKIEIRRKVNPDDFIAKTTEIALSAVSELFDQFGWEHVPVESIRKDQQDLLSGSKYG